QPGRAAGHVLILTCRRVTAMLLGVCFMTGIRCFLLIAGAFFLLCAVSRSTTAGPLDNTVRAQAFIDDHVSRLRPLELAANRAWWNANVTGRAEDFAEKEKTQNRIDQAL